MCIGASYKYTRTRTCTRTRLLFKDALNKMLIVAPYQPKGTDVRTLDALVEFQITHCICANTNGTGIHDLLKKCQFFIFFKCILLLLINLHALMCETWTH